MSRIVSVLIDLASILVKYTAVWRFSNIFMHAAWFVHFKTIWSPKFDINCASVSIFLFHMSRKQYTVATNIITYSVAFRTTLGSCL